MLVKALSKDIKAIRGNSMQYELNKWYELGEGEKVIPCEKGFHYCKRIADLGSYYNLEDSRVFEVEIGDIEIKEGNKYVTNKIKLVREITEEEIDTYFKDNLKNLVNDKSWYIRREVAKYKYGLDKLINDKDWRVRCEVAKHGYGLDILVNDKDWLVRLKVAKQGYGLNKLINDKDCYVRLEVAKQGYGLNKLINDKDWCVRREVAKQGYELDKLINDENWYVRREAKKQLKKTI